METRKDSEAAAALAVLQSFVHRSSTEPAPVNVQLRPERYVVIQLAAALTGYTPKAVTMKVQEGVWREGYEWVRGPDGRILIDLEGYRKWVEGGKSR